MRVTDQGGTLCIRGTGVQHRFQPPCGTFERKSADLCHWSVYLVNHCVYDSRLVPAGEEIEIVRLGELQQRSGRKGIRGYCPCSRF